MTVRILCGDCLELLRSLSGGSIHCCITSPPYWGLRDYGLPPLVWGGDADCEHEWGDELTARQRGKVGDNSTLDGGPQAGGDGRLEAARQGSFCHRCGAWRGSLGLEPTPELYVAHLVEIFREVRRVLRDDGTLWLNLGDSYTSGNRNGHGTRDGYKQQTNRGMCGQNDPQRPPMPMGLKPKDLVGIPWRVAFALQADGWWLRSDIIWAKGISFCDTWSGQNMPESMRDRPTQSHEHIFLLSKAARYFYDYYGVREKGSSGPSDLKKMREQKARIGGKNKHLIDLKVKASKSTNIGRKRGVGNAGYRNMRNVWTINSSGFKAKHFATFPPALVEPIVKAGTSERGVCPECGAPWERVVERTVKPPPDRVNNNPFKHDAMTTHGEGAATLRNVVENSTIGWRPTCEHDAVPIPATVLDPFGGAGTVGLVADQLGRDAVLMDLSADYCEMAETRIKADALMFADVQVTQ